MPSGSEPLESWLIETTDTIIDAGLDPTRWSDVPQQFTKRWPDAATLLQAADSRAKCCLGVIQQGFRPDLMADYEQHYHRVNPWIPFWARQPIMRPFTSDEKLPSSGMVRTEFYHDFLKPHGGIDCAAGIKIFDDNDRFAWIAIHYGSRAAGRYNQTMPRVLKRLAPAFRAALALNRELSLRTTATSTLEQVMDAFAIPAILICDRGLVRSSNTLAATELARAANVCVQLDGKLRLTDPASDRLLNDAMRRPHQSGQATGIDIVLHARDGTSTGLLSLFPIRASRGPVIEFLFAPERMNLVLLRDLASKPNLQRDVLRQAFGLTSAESRLAAQMAAGETLEEAADALGTSKETARSQLKAVFVKTNTHRQAELVALLSRLTLRPSSTK